jgi:hypothetical protein
MGQVYEFGSMYHMEEIEPNAGLILLMFLTTRDYIGYYGVGPSSERFEKKDLF